MKKGMLPILVAFALSVVAPSAWAKECPKLYKECQELLKTNPNAEAKKLCEEGIKLHEEGQHDKSVKTLREALSKLKAS